MTAPKVTYNKNTHLNTNLGIISKDDIEFWSYYNKLHIEKYSLRDLSKILGIDKRPIRKVFEKLNLPLVSKKDTYTRLHNKSKKTWINTLGVDNPRKDNNIVEKSKNSYFEKTGYSHQFKNPEVRNLISFKFNNRTLDNWKGILEKLDILLLDNFKGTHERLSSGKYKLVKYRFKHNTCGTIFKDSFSDGHILCPNCHKFVSFPEMTLRNYLLSKGFRVESNARNIIPPYEIDIYLPELKIAFEYNGYCFHHEESQITPELLKSNKILRVKPDGYHQKKRELCKNKNIELFHLWENEKGNNMDDIIRLVDNIIGEWMYVKS